MCWGSTPAAAAGEGGRRRPGGVGGTALPGEGGTGPGPAGGTARGSYWGLAGLSS